MTHFELRAKDGLARLGRLETNHGSVATPLLMPVVHPAKSEVSPKQMLAEFGFQMVITNSYIIKSTERFRETALSQGVHGLLDFNGPIMTDSGTYQMYFHSLPDEEINPIEIVRFQRDIGSDIGTILDTFSDSYVPKTTVERDVAISLDRAKRSVAEKGNMLLAGTVQGGIYPDLRARAAMDLAPLDFDIHPIGGVVPLMEQYRYSDIVRATLSAKRYLPPDRPVHLFGCGHPMFFAQAALLGCDLFDSASYAKFAESGRMLFPTGTVRLEGLRELPCECPVCSSTTVDGIKSLDSASRELLLTKHNLYVTAAEMRRVRQAISEGRLLELAAIRARGHPNLYEALRVFLELIGEIDSSVPSAGSSSVFYTGTETSKHPLLRAFQDRVIETYPYRKTMMLLLVPHRGDRPFSDTCALIEDQIKVRSPEEVVLIYVTPIGAIPWELEHVFPAQQCLFPSTLDDSDIKTAQERVQRLVSTLSFDECVWLSRDSPTDQIVSFLSSRNKVTRVSGVAEVLEMLPPQKLPTPSWTTRMIAAILAYQWGVSDATLLGLEHLETSISKATGKIRHVMKDGKVLFTLVPMTGLLTPTYEGGMALLRAGAGNDHTVIVEDDAVEFVAQGKSAMTGFVHSASPNLKAGDEALVMDNSGELLGVGKAVLDGSEMKAFKRGVAVVIRHSRH